MNLIQRSILDTIDDTYRARLGLSKVDPVFLKEIADRGELRVTPKAGIRVDSTKIQDVPAYVVSVNAYQGKRLTVCECIAAAKDTARIRDMLTRLFDIDPKKKLHEVFMLRVNITEDLMENKARALAGIQLRYEPVFHTRVPECLVEFTSEDIANALRHSDAIAYYSCDGEFFFAPTHPTCGIDKGMWTNHDILHMIGIE